MKSAKFFFVSLSQLESTNECFVAMVEHHHQTFVQTYYQSTSATSIPVHLPLPFEQSQLSWNLMWNDPIRQVKLELDSRNGFAFNSRRGTGQSFSMEALDAFLAKHELSHIIRAHEYQVTGVSVQFNGRLLTVFSTSDYCGGRNDSACILLAQKKISVIRLAAKGERRKNWKMPLIWNDDRMEFLENPAHFDRTQYVIVRKLFLQFKEHVQNIGEQWIRDTFNEYGNIERIEVFIEENHRTWAYLTFSKDHEAYRALTEASKVDEIDKILPADTWCQPSSFLFTPVENETVVVDALSKFEMADVGGKGHTDRSDLLRKLISLSTKSNSESLKEALNDRILPSLKRFDFQLTNAINGTAISLSEIRSILRCIGPHISELGICFEMDKYPANIDRIFFKMCQYIGPNLNTIRLKSVPINQDWLRQLKPLLNRIECLFLAASNYDFDYDIDFQLYCPNLKTLKMSMNLNGELLSKRQPKLERISILHNQYIEERLVLKFIKNNPQLLYLKIEANDSNNLLKQIPVHLTNLEKLCLYQGYPDITADNLEHLAAMKHLKRLKLMYMEPDELNGILNCLPKFKQLQQLKLHVFYDGIDTADLDDIYCPNVESIITLAQELRELECFHIRYCNIDAETLKNFIRSAKKLKVLGIYRCGLEITDTILESIESIRRAADPALMVLYADKIQPELNTEKTYNNVKLVKL